MKVLPVLGLCLLLTSCAGDYGEYAGAMQAHSYAESTRISAQSTAISEVIQATKTETAMEATLLAVIGMMQIERLQPVSIGMTAPRTGNDVLHALVNTLPMGFVVGGMVWQSSILASELKGMTFTDSPVTNSFNPTSATAGYNASASGVSPAIVVRPEIVIVP